MVESFLFMRHGQTHANAGDVICGHTDLPLDAAGLTQARAAGQRLTGAGVARIIASPLARARQTAHVVSRALGVPVLVVEGLSERNWGAWEGMPRATLRRDETPPGGESPGDFRARIRAAFRGLDLSVPTLIVAHSGTDREIHAALTDAPHARLVNGQVVRWAQEEATWNCHDFFTPTG